MFTTNPSFWTLEISEPDYSTMEKSLEVYPENPAVWLVQGRANLNKFCVYRDYTPGLNLRESKGVLRNVTVKIVPASTE